MADDFIVVKSKSKKKRNRGDDTENNLEKYAEDLFNKVESCKKNLKDYDNEMYASKVIFKLKQILRTRFKANTLNIVCYGLGSFDDNLASRYQFALLLLILDAVKQEEPKSINHIELFDPQFTDADIRVIQHHYGLEIASSNEKALKSCVSTTLFFMPHCPKALYNNLLYANWSMDRLLKLIIFGNSFSHLQSVGVSETVYSYISDSFSLLEETEIESSCDFTNAFVDLSLNMFKSCTSLKDNQFINEFLAVYDSQTLKQPSYSVKEEIIQ